jgi:thymidylate kinase
MRKPSRAGSSPLRGLWIAVYGPDGVGKSTVIEAVKRQVKTAFSAVTQFHFRPMFGSMRVHHPPVTAPHSRPPRGCLFSSAKLVYWLLDCWCGYLLVIHPGVRHSELAIFDRFYSDILVDPRRYRLPASVQPLARWLTRLAPRPDLCILLDAPVEVIQHRKAEVPSTESQRQRLAYLAMFRSLPNNLIVNVDRPVSEAAQQISAALLAHHPSPELEKGKGLLIANS